MKPLRSAAPWIKALALAVLASGPKPLFANYAEKRGELERTRAELQKTFVRAKGRKAKREVLAQARAKLLESLSKSLFPAWYGTDYDFYGKTDRPGTGTIACGYFVGTVLAHAGFNVDRIALGDLASEHIALSLTGQKNMRRYSDRPTKEVVDETIARGPGLYLVGLDRHAGFMLVQEGQASFIHASYAYPMKVLNEVPDGLGTFGSSRYRIIAKLLDNRMMRKWLNKGRFRARKRRAK